MSDAAEVKMAEVKARDRSPSYPAIPLQVAIERLIAFENHFKRQPVPAAKVGMAWGLKESNGDADRYLAALRSFGLVDYLAGAVGRQVVVSEDGRAFLEARQDAVRRHVLKRVALRPKAIRQFWSRWASHRPAEDACLDALTHYNGFSERGARAFLKVYDATIAFAGLSDSDRVPLGTEIDEGGGAGNSWESAGPEAPPSPVLRSARPIPRQAADIALGERELTTGLLSKGASFRLIVSGSIGSKEIDILIRKLELDKEILANGDNTSSGISRHG